MGTTGGHQWAGFVAAGGQEIVALDKRRSRRRSSSAGKNVPALSFGIFRSRSPAVVVNPLGRVPLRWVLRSVVRSNGAAPMNAVAYLSISSWQTVSVATQIWSVTSVSFSSPRRSSRARWSRGLRCVLVVVDLDRFSLTITRWLLTSTIRRSEPGEPHHPRGRNPKTRANYALGGPRPEDSPSVKLIWAANRAVSSVSSGTAGEGPDREFAAY